MITLFIFRHGETDWNVEQRFQGHIDIPLNENGKLQARDLTPSLSAHSIEAILSSDLSRAVETAQIINTSLKLPIFQDPRLREAHLGVAQGLTPEEIEQKLGKTSIERWKSTLITDADISYPGGESGNQVMNRAFEALEHFIHSHPFKRIGIATHGGVIRRIMQKLTFPHHHHIPIPNGVLYRIHYHSVEKRFFLKNPENPLASLIPMASQID